MYIYYEEFPAFDPSATVTEIVMSSDGRSTRIDWKNKQEKQYQELFSSLFKQVPLASRIYDEHTHVWTFIGHTGQVIIAGLESFITQSVFKNVTVKKIEDLVTKAAAGTLNRVKTTHSVEENLKYKEKDFFYSAPQASNEPSGQELLAKLAPLLQLSAAELEKESDDKALKRLYRAAALRLHPDRNNGDGSRMSELNMLWNIFMQKV